MVVAAEKPLQRRLIAGAMAAGGAVQAFNSPDELPARIETDLLIYVLGWQLQDSGFSSLLARLPEGARVVPVLRASQLESVVKLLEDARIATVLVAEELGGQTISQVVSKLLYSDLFGLEKVMPWGVRIYSMLVGDYNEKSTAIAAIGDFAHAMGVRRKFREQIDQCIDEMLMNALYDAPVDDRGVPLFAEVPVKERVALKLTEKAVVQYACDGDRFAVSVRDSFGSLKKSTVLAYLDKCLHASGADQIDRKAGGAGLGLYLISNSATEVYFHIFEHAATEVVCTFDLGAARSQLRAFGVFEESISTAARLKSELPMQMVSARRGRRREDLEPEPPRASPLLPAVMSFAVLLLITAVTLVALPYLRRAPKAALRIETDPPGATVYLDGRVRGSAPLTVGELEAGRSYAVRGTLPGHKEDDQLVTAADGESTIRLRLPAEASAVSVESDPAGAQIFVDGKATGKITPASLELVPGRDYVIKLLRDGFAAQELRVSAPAPGEHAVYRTSLGLSDEVASLTIEVDPPNAAVSVDGMALLPPGKVHETFVKPGAKHVVAAALAGYVDAREELTVDGGQHRTLKLTLVEGGKLAVRANVPARVFVDDRAVGMAPVASLALAEGRHTLALKAQAPPLDYRMSFTVEKGKTVEEKLDFGVVEVKAPGVTAHLGGADAPGVTAVRLLAGTQKILLTNDAGEKKEKEVKVAAGETVVIDTW